jgi:hypothetical protein
MSASAKRPLNEFIFFNLLRMPLAVEGRVGLADDWAVFAQSIVPNALSLAGVGAATTTLAVVKELDEAGSRPLHMLSLTGFAFPVESAHRALHVLNKLMQGEVSKQQCSFTVPGGQPALHVAALHGNREACTSLLVNGADVNTKNKASLSALHEAVTGGSRECVDILLKYNADERTSDAEGNTPLHLACKVADMGCATALMRSKTAAVVLVTPNSQGKTPLDVCTSHTMRLAIERGMRSHFIAVPTQRKKTNIMQ